jgi:homoserine kinase
VSGAGPSVFAVAGSRAAADRAGRSMARAWRVRGLQCDVLVSRMGARGALGL